MKEYQVTLKTGMTQLVNAEDFDVDEAALFFIDNENERIAGFTDWSFFIRSDYNKPAEESLPKKVA